MEINSCMGGARGFMDVELELRFGLEEFGSSKFGVIN